jgi:hypothetical protein
MRDLDLMSTPIEYDDAGFNEAAAIRGAYGTTLAQLRRDVKPGSPTWSAAAEKAKAPVRQRAAWLDGEAAKAAQTARALAAARLTTVSRPPKDAVDDAQLARLRDGLAKVDPAQRSGQLLHAARQYAAGQHAPADEAVLRAAFTAPEIWGAAPLFADELLTHAEAIITLPEVGGHVWRAKLAARLAEGLRQAIGEAPAPIVLGGGGAPETDD